MRISDWSSDVCSSDLREPDDRKAERQGKAAPVGVRNLRQAERAAAHQQVHEDQPRRPAAHQLARPEAALAADEEQPDADQDGQRRAPLLRSEDPTSELQSLMRTSYAVLCLT